MRNHIKVGEDVKSIYQHSSAKIMKKKNIFFQTTGREEKINFYIKIYLHERHLDSEQEHSLYLSKKDVFIVTLNQRV